MAALPDWMIEQQRVDALLGTSANGYGSGDPNADEVNPYGGNSSAVAPYIDPSTGQFIDTYGYFDPKNVQAITDLSAQMQEAFQKGDNAALQSELAQYQGITKGLTPSWLLAANTNPQGVAMNATNPGGVNYQPPQAQTPAPAAPAAPSGFARDANGNLVSTSAAATPADPTQAVTPTRGSITGSGTRGTNIGGIGSAALGASGGLATGGNPTDTGTPVNGGSLPTRGGSTLGGGAPTIGGSGGGGLPTRGTNPPITGGIQLNPPTGIGQQPAGGGSPAAGGGTPATGGGNPGTGGTGPGGVNIPSGGYGSPYTPPGGSTAPVPNSAYTSAAFPTWSTWNGGQPYTGGDPGMMATSEQNRATDYGNLFQNQFGNAYGDAQSKATAYQNAADTSYSDLYSNPGFNAQESDLIQNGGIPGGLNSLRASDSDLANNYLTPEEQAAIQGNPNAVYDAFDPNTLNDLAKTGTDATQTFFGNNYQAAQNALNSGQQRATDLQNQYSTNARGDLGTLNTSLNAAIDPTKLGISDDEVQRLKDQAGRGIALQYGAALDQLQRGADSAGNVSPLALSAARERLLRSQAIDQQNAVNQADLAARAQQRTANQDISNRQMQAATTVGQAGIGLEGDIANTGLNSNQSMAALNAGTQATYGNIGTNLGLAATKQKTDAATTAGNTAIGQAQYADTNAANRAATVATNRQAVNTGNLNTKYTQGQGVAAANSANAATIGNARIAGQQAARNYWAGANQFQGNQANAAAGQQLTGAQTSLSGQGQAGSTAVGNLNARRNPITIAGVGGFTL